MEEGLEIWKGQWQIVSKMSISSSGEMSPKFIYLYHLSPFLHMGFPSTGCFLWWRAGSMFLTFIPSFLHYAPTVKGIWRRSDAEGKKKLGWTWLLYCEKKRKKEIEGKKKHKPLNKGGKGLSITEKPTDPSWYPTSSLVPGVENNITMLVNFIILLSGRG